MIKRLDSETIRRAAKESSSIEEFRNRVRGLTHAGVERPVFDHVAIPVANIEGTLEWYQGIFDDVEVLFQDEEWAFISTGGIKIAFVLEGTHPAHLAFEVSEEVLYELSDAFDLAVQQNRPDTISLYIVGGPDNICIEFVHYITGLEDDNG